MRTVLIAALMSMAAPVAAAPADDFRKLTEEYWSWVLNENPVFASALGKAGHEGKVRDESLAAIDRRATNAEALLRRLEAIDASALPTSERTNHGVLRRQLTDEVAGNRFEQRYINFTNRSGWHQQFAGMGDNLPFRSKADFQSYLDRLKQYPKVSADAIAVADKAVAAGLTLPCSAIGGYEKSITGLIAEKPEDSRFYAPMKRDKPAGISNAEWTAMQAEAAAIISKAIYPALRDHAQWYAARYAPRCAKSDGVSAQKNGRAYYDYRVREQTTTDMDAETIHQLGLKEVARIRSEMEAVAKKAGFASREAFIADLRTNPVHYARTPEELMQTVARETKRIDGKMPGLFTVLPRLPYGIREIPAEIAEGTTTAYYNPGSPETGIAGTYYVNTSKLDQRPLWEVPALSVHEAVPGHHHQIALQQELDLPEWRRNGAFFTAFVEGWGLYSERLGIEMGLYDTPAKDMGRLSYEMWRACRLVVDTGIHAKGWTKAEAIAFMTDNSALSAANIEAEVNRYISWPGQALAYKIGELRIRELRSRAEAALGTRFDLRRFHDAVLGQGAVPLDVLEMQIDGWIASEKERS